MQVINHHIAIMEEPEAKNPMMENDTLMGVMDDFKNSTISVQEKRKAFNNDLYEKQKEMISEKVQSIKQDKIITILEYLSNMKDWSNKDKIKFSPRNFNQVSYVDLYNSDVYPGPKLNFNIKDEDALSTFRMVMQGVVDGESGQQPDDIRFIGDYRIAIDFEEYGYHIDTSHPVSELTDLIEINNRENALSIESNGLKEKSQKISNISFMLSNLSDHIESYYGEEVAQVMRDNGKAIHSLTTIVADNYKNTTKQAEAIIEILTLVDQGAWGDVVREEIESLLPSVSISHDAIEAHCSATRKAFFNRVNYEDCEKEYDENVNKALELRASGDTLSFKRHYNTLNVFEKLSIDLVINNEDIEDNKGLSL